MVLWNKSKIKNWNWRFLLKSRIGQHRTIFQAQCSCAFTPTLIFSPSFQYAITSWKGKKNLMKKSWTNMCTTVFKCFTNQFWNLNFIKVKVKFLFVNSMLLMIQTITIFGRVVLTSCHMVTRSTSNCNTLWLVTLTSHHDSCHWFDELISFIS
jgi:hypothetical protein